MVEENDTTETLIDADSWCFEHTDSNIKDMTSCVDMMKIWIGLIDKDDKFASDSLRILIAEEATAYRVLTEIRHIRRCVGDGLMTSRTENVGTRQEVHIMSDVAVQKVAERMAVCRRIIEPFRNEEETDIEIKEAISDLVEDKFFMKPKTKRRVKAAAKKTACDHEPQVQVRTVPQIKNDPKQHRNQRPAVQSKLKPPLEIDPQIKFKPRK